MTKRPALRSVKTRWRSVALALTIALALPGGVFAADTPVPLLAKDKPVDWWFVFKFNASKGFAGCVPAQKGAKKQEDEGDRECPFGGKVQTKAGFGQQFAFASKTDGTLQQGHGCAGATDSDPIGVTFAQVYNGTFNYLIWNDQFYRDPAVAACKGDSCGAPWGHSKGLLAWNDDGNGFIMQVSTPAWPRSGSVKFDKRKGNKGNTLGCNASNNNLRASQHFFALKLTKADLVEVLKALKNASVVTDPTKLQIVHNGGPTDVRKLVEDLGERPAKKDESVIKKELSSGVVMISKPSGLHVPPWQMVSAELEMAGERAATWWTKPWIPTTTSDTEIKCWDDTLLKDKEPGPVAISKSGSWDKQEINLTAPSNHAKIGTAVTKGGNYAIFGDMNQQGAIKPPGCDKSQNGRGGLFFAIKNDDLFKSIKNLIDGETASTKAPK